MWQMKILKMKLKKLMVWKKLKEELKQATKESHEIAKRSAEGHTRDIGGSSSQPSGLGIKRGLRQSFTTREAEIPARGIDPYIFPTK